MDWRGIQVRIAWNRCARRRWPPTAQLAFSPQERHKSRNVLLYWWAGRGQRSLPEGQVPIRAGLCHWSRPGWTYQCTQNPHNPLGVTAIHFDLLNARDAVIPPDAARLPPEQLRVQAPKLVNEVTRWIAERAMDVRSGSPLDPEIEYAANSLFRGLLIKLTHDTEAGRKAPEEPGDLAWRRLTVYIQEHLHDLGGVAHLAQRTGFTRSHFSRLFKDRFGLSPQAYVINARLALAKELLRGTTLSVSSIAERSGHGDVFGFSKQFKKLTGLTPTAYRART